MFKKVDESCYPIIKKFINQYKFKVCPNSILEGNTIGEIFADDDKYPSIALAWLDAEKKGYLFGQTNDINMLNKSLSRFFDDVIAEESSGKRSYGLFLSLYNEDYWSPLIDKIIDRNMSELGRWSPVFDKNTYLKKKDTVDKELPEGYKFSKITKDILSLEENKDLKEEILFFWKSIEKFLMNGFGFCVLKNEKVISTSISAYLSDNSHYEISINTFDPNERNKGFGTKTALAFIDHCLENGYFPYWEADTDNYPSHKIADKLGFINPKIEMDYLFLSNNADNLLQHTIFYCKNNDKIDNNFIKTNIERVFAIQNEKPTSTFIFSLAIELARIGMKDEVILLIEEVLKNDKDNLKFIIDHDSFKLFHDSKEWNDMVKKYS